MYIVKINKVEYPFKSKANADSFAQSNKELRPKVSKRT